MAVSHKGPKCPNCGSADVSTLRIGITEVFAGCNRCGLKSVSVPPPRRDGSMHEESITIKPCPFCGSLEVEILKTNEHAIWVRCAHCGSESTADASKRAAIIRWNRRSESEAEAKIVWDEAAE